MPDPSATTPSIALEALAGLRSAPPLDRQQREALLQALQAVLARCDWFTFGVMAPSAPAAVKALRALEQSQGWEPLALDPGGEALEAMEGPVFLKGNQNNGRFQLRREAGLGEGLLIAGHSATDPAAEGTWGPLPLDLFAAGAS